MAIVAISLLVIIMLGVAFYYISRMFGAGKEVADGVDGGTLGIARRASTRVTVNLASLGSSEVNQFGPLSDPPNSNQINLLTYNRLVGQAMIVSINTLAMQANKQLLTNNTSNVWNAVKTVGTALTSQLNPSTGNSFQQNSFNQISNLNNASMVNSSSGNSINYVNSSTGYMRNGLASNIYIPQDLINDFSGVDSQGNPDDFYAGNKNNNFQGSLASLVVPTTPPFFGSQGSIASSLTFNPSTTSPSGSYSGFTSSLNPPLTGAPLQTGSSAPKYQSGSGAPGYLPGYTNLPFIPGNAPALVPIVPFTPPHLVSKYDFQQQTKSSPVVTSSLTSSIPPNAFQASGQANQNVANMQNLASSMACAVVGCPSANVASGQGTSAIQTMAGQYPMQIPGGFIRLENLPGLNPPGGNMVTDGSNDIFNNELYGSPGITQSNNGVFTTQAGAVPAWATYNNAVAAGPQTATTTTTAANGTTTTTTVPIQYYPSPDSNATKYLNSLNPPVAYPPSINSNWAAGAADSNGNYYMRKGSAVNNPASQSDLQGITSNAGQCYSPNNYNPPDPTSICSTQLQTWESNYNRNTQQGPAPSGKYNPVEYMKASLLMQKPSYYSSSQTAVVTSPGVSSGLYLTQMESNGTATSVGVPMRQPTQVNGGSPLYATPGSPLELFNQVGNNTSSNQLTAGTALYNVYQRCREIKPGVSPGEVISALANAGTFDMGGNGTSNILFLYVNPQTGMFVCDSTGPVQYNALAYSDQSSSSIVDGLAPGMTTATNNTSLSTTPSLQAALQSSGNLNAYQADGYLVDVQAISTNSTNQNPVAQDYTGQQQQSLMNTQYLGDANYHDQPYTSTASIIGMDAAVWIPCSGYHNLLGVVQFQTAVPSGATNGISGTQPPLTLGNDSSNNNTIPNGGGVFSAPN